MSAYIVELNSNAVSGNKFLLGTVYLDATPVVRCRDCKHGGEVTWPVQSQIPPDYLNCRGYLVTTWDYYNDEPQDNPVPPDGFCAWGERRTE